MVYCLGHSGYLSLLLSAREMTSNQEAVSLTVTIPCLLQHSSWVTDCAVYMWTQSHKKTRWATVWLGLLVTALMTWECKIWEGDKHKKRKKQKKKENKTKQKNKKNGKKRMKKINKNQKKQKRKEKSMKRKKTRQWNVTCSHSDYFDVAV